MKLQEMKVGQEFMDEEIKGCPLKFYIVGDHKYTISDLCTTIIVAQDIGNTYGKVIDIIKISGEDQYNEMMEKISSSYNPQEIVGTHNGIFHADEVSAIALRIVFGNKKMPKIIRSRDPEILKKADIIVDVSQKYDGVKYFDHHQFNKDDELYGLSSAGLIWKQLKEKFDLDFSSIDELVSEIDMQDTGIQKMPKYHIANIIGNMNQEDITGKEQDAAFYKAVEMMVSVFSDLKRREDLLKEKIRIAEEKAEMISIDDVNIIKLPKNVGMFIPVHLFIGKGGDVLSQYDKNEGVWKTMTIPLEKGDFESKYSLVPTGSEEEIFCHKGGFFQSTRSKNGKFSFAVDGVGEIFLSE